MAVSTVSTYNLFQTTINNVLKSETDLNTLQGQVSSGLVSQNFAGISGQASQFLQLDDQLSRSNQYLTNNSIISTRINTTSNVLGQVINTAQQINSLISKRRNGTLIPTGGSFNTQLTQLWQQLTGEINTNVAGFNVLSGSSTSTQAISTNFPVISSAGNLTANYYQGSDQDLSARVSDGETMTYNIRADADGFQQLVTGVATASAGDTSNSDDQLQSAETMIQNALSAVTSYQAQANSNTVTLSSVNTNLTSLQTYWKGVKEGISNTDLVTASTQISIDQGVLQAAFSAFSRISNLSLVNYLK